MSIDEPTNTGWRNLERRVKKAGGSNLVGWWRGRDDPRKALGEKSPHGSYIDHDYKYIDREGITVWATEPYGLCLGDRLAELQVLDHLGWQCWILPGWWNDGTVRLEFRRKRDVEHARAMRCG